MAGRKVGWFLLFCTMGATLIGGGASVDAIGKTYEWGILMLLVSTGWYLHFIFSGLIVAPKFREANLYTVAGYFGHRFGEGPRFLVLILSLLLSVFIAAAQEEAFGSVFSAVLAEFSDATEVLNWAIIISGSMVVVYSTAEVLRAVIHTNFYQFVILLPGFAITLCFCVPDLLGTWGNFSESAPDSFFKIEGGKRWFLLIITIPAFLLGETYAPGYARRYCVGKNIKETRFGITGIGIFLAVIFQTILVVVLWTDIIGLLLFTYHLWAPAIVLPVCIGAFWKHRSSGLTGIIFITMLVSTLFTLVYKLVLFLYKSYEWTLLSANTHDFMEAFDPSVFGELVSCLVTSILGILFLLHKYKKSRAE